MALCYCKGFICSPARKQECRAPFFLFIIFHYHKGYLVPVFTIRLGGRTPRGATCQRPITAAININGLLFSANIKR